MLSSISWNLSKLVYYFKGHWSRSAASEGPYLFHIRYDFVNPQTLNSGPFLQSSGLVPCKEELFFCSLVLIAECHWSGLPGLTQLFQASLGNICVVISDLVVWGLAVALKRSSCGSPSPPTLSWAAWNQPGAASAEEEMFSSWHLLQVRGWRFKFSSAKLRFLSQI